MALLTSLQIDGGRQFFVTVQRAPRDTGNFLVVDDGLAILNDGDPTPDQCDIEGLPFSWLAGQFRRSRQETVNAAHVVAGWFLNGIGFNLDFVPAPQVDAAVGIRGAVEFNMQFEILKFGIIDQFRAVSGTDQVTVFNLPHGRTWSRHLPSCQIFAIEQWNRPAPFRGTASLE